MHNDNDMRECSLVLAEATVLAIEPDRLDDFRMLSVAFMSRARARKVVEYGMDPIADLFEASVLPIVYESLQTGLGDLIKSALKSAAAAVVHALKSKNQTHERLIVSLTEREIKQLVKSVRSKAKSLGLKNEAVDALAGVLTHKLLMAK